MNMTLEDLKIVIDRFIKDNPDAIDMEVYATCNYGDRGRTMQLIGLGEPKIEQFRETEYSESGKAIDEENFDSEDDFDSENDKEVTRQNKVVVFWA